MGHNTVLQAAFVEGQKYEGPGLKMNGESPETTILIVVEEPPGFVMEEPDAPAPEEAWAILRERNSRKREETPE